MLVSVRQLVNEFDLHSGLSCLIWCPGCVTTPDTDGMMGLHSVTTVDPDGNHPAVEWTWNGSLTRPTFGPSILVHQGKLQPRCHSFVVDGRWQFLPDSTHSLAGQTVGMLDLPAWVVDD